MKRALAVLLAALAAAATSTSPAVAKESCSLTAKAPKVLDTGEVRSAGWARCSRTVRRSVDITYMYVLTSGKKLRLSGVGVSGTFRAGARKGWGEGSSNSCEWLTHERHSRRYKDDLPVKFFVRMQLYTHDFGKRLKRKDSRAVSLAALCPDSPLEPSSSPRA
jgi:Ni/Co efflux regulator RcnB